MELLAPFIIGLLLGGLSIYLLTRAEINRLLAQLSILQELLNKRLGYRAPQEIEAFEEERKKHEKYEDGDHDIFALRLEATTKSEEEYRQKNGG